MDDVPLRVGWYGVPADRVAWITEVVEVATLTVG